VRRVESSRHRHVDLLRRRPLLDDSSVDSPGTRAVRRGDQLRALLSLVDHGVLSAGEFERQEDKVFRRLPYD
jgi:hypothetical protein